MKDHIKIMIVDDDPDVLMATARVIRKAGYTVLESQSPVECQSIILDQKPDLLLLDVHMPKLDGIELCRVIKSDPRFQGIYVILISHLKTASEDQAEGLETGADGYIARPITNRELIARIDSMVRILKAERDRDQLIDQLKRALEEIKTLSGLLPICSYCKKIRDDKGYWNQIEDYLSRHTSTQFSHGICEECAQEHFPDIDLSH